MVRSTHGSSRDTVWGPAGRCGTTQPVVPPPEASMSAVHSRLPSNSSHGPSHVGVQPLSVTLKTLPGAPEVASIDAAGRDVVMARFEVVAEPLDTRSWWSPAGVVAGIRTDIHAVPSVATAVPMVVPSNVALSVEPGAKPP